MISVLLADDHPVLRRGLRDLFEKEKGIAVVGEAGNGEEAIRLTERLKPDVMVLDLFMPGLSGFQVLGEFARRRIATRVVVLTMYDSPVYQEEAIRQGACAFVAKGCSEEDLLRAVLESARAPGSPPVEPSRGIDTPDLPRPLTRREIEVLRLVAAGRTSAEIAAELGISRRTVENHRANIMAKMGFESIADLVRHALTHDIITLN
jgi:DNA-binding NarL/FixJ family response regulator